MLTFGVSSQVVEELAQNVFLKAHENLDSYDPRKSKFSTWLFSIAKNQALSHLLRKKIKSFFGFSNELIESEKTVSDVFVYANNKQERHMILKALEELPMVYRSCAIMHFLNDLSLEDIAKIQKCSLGTVKSRLSRAKTLLRKDLKGVFNESN